jgi:hypothetical protein
MEIQVEHFMKDTFDESAMWYYQYRITTWFIPVYDIQDKGELHDWQKNARKK